MLADAIDAANAGDPASLVGLVTKHGSIKIIGLAQLLAIDACTKTEPPAASIGAPHIPHEDDDDEEVDNDEHLRAGHKTEPPAASTGAPYVPHNDDDDELNKTAPVADLRPGHMEPIDKSGA